MPMMWRVTERRLLDGAVVPGEPFAVFRDDDGDIFVACKEMIELPADPSKATETAGTLAEFSD
jgi:hypothetical protein